MKDGYYLSTYIYIDELAHLLDVKIRHDQNIALFEKKGNVVELVHYWELERVTGLKKHANTFYNVKSAKRFINKLLKKYNCDISDMVEIWGTPQLSNNDRYLVTDITDNLTCHSIYHLYSAMLSDSEKFYKDNTLAFSVDAGPDAVLEIDANDRHFYAGAVVRNGEIKLSKVSSPGRLWSYCKRKFNIQEGTLMALATASNTAFIADYSEYMELTDKNSYGQAKLYVDSIYKLAVEAISKNELTLYTGLDERFTIKENLLSMVGKVIQRTSEKIMEKNIFYFIEEFNINPIEYNLSITGGFALNCPTNTYLMNKFNFKSFYTVPCVSDCGLSLGIGLYSFSKDFDVEFKLKNAYYGDEDTLENDDLNNEYLEFIKSIKEVNGDDFISDLEEHPIVWFNGRAEMGPRALGNRSILASPKTLKTTEILNNLKQREWWRPVAPIILNEYVGKYFNEKNESPYMLRVHSADNNSKENIPAVLHLDGTARIQTIDEANQPLLYKLIKYYGDTRGEYVICNTSLNDNNEPIINKIEEAFNFALRKNISVIYINGIRLELKNHDKYIDDKPKQRDLKEFNMFSITEKENLIDNLNPINLTKDEYCCYLENRNLFPDFKMEDKSSVRRVQMVYKMITTSYGEIFDRN